MTKMRITFLFLFTIAILVCCKKNNTNPADIVQQMRVLEYKTNTPMAGVKVDMFSCIPPPSRSDCDTGHLIFSGFTNDSGIVATNEFYHAAFGITLTKDGYITAQGGIGDRYMYPAAYINLHLIRENVYADTAAFVYYFDSTVSPRSYIYMIPPPADTVIRFQLPGDSTYTIYCGAALLPAVSCDTCQPAWITNNTVRSLHLAKFGDSTVTIRY